MPERIRPTFCTLKRIFISEIQGEYTGFIFAGHDGPLTGALIAIGKEVLDKHPSTHDVVSWKDQTSVFNADIPFLHPKPDLVQISYNLKMSFLKEDGSFYLLIHELGHVIDEYNRIDPVIESAPKNGRADLMPWASLSWNVYEPLDGELLSSEFLSPLASASFWHQTSLCRSAACGDENFILPRAALKFYRSLRKSAFPTAYAGKNGLEDFAENWAWYIARNFKDANYQISIPGQGLLNMNKMFEANEALKKKQEFINKLWNNPKLHLTP